MAYGLSGNAPWQEVSLLPYITHVHLYVHLVLNFLFQAINVLSQEAAKPAQPLIDDEAALQFKADKARELPRDHTCYSLNSLKGDYIGDYNRGY